MQKFFKQAHSQKWEGKTHSNQQFLLTIADMDFAFPQSFKKSLINKISLSNNFAYKKLSRQYFQSIINWYDSRHIKVPQGKIVREQIVQSPSLLNIVYLVIQNFTEKNDGILLVTPTFYSYQKTILSLGRKPVFSKLYNQHNKENISRYDINFMDLEQKAKQSKMMIFCNPQNPSGRVWGRKHAQKVVSICKKHNILLLSDEILCDLLPEKQLSQFWSLVNSDYERLIVCKYRAIKVTASSLKGGYAIIKNTEIREKYFKIADSMSLNLNEIAMFMTEIVYSEQGRQWIQKTNQIIKRNYDYLLQKASKTLLIISAFEGPYIIVLSFEGYVKYIERWWRSQKVREGRSESMVKTFLASKKITGVQIPYHGVYQNFLTQIRFAIGVEQDYFKKFADTLISALWEVEYQFKEIDAKL